MSYHELSQETANACSQLAFDYHPDCYCAFHFVHADYPPRAKYRGLGAKYLQVWVWRTIPDASDRYVAGVVADTGPELLRQLRHVFDCLRAGTQDDFSLQAEADELAALHRALRHPLLLPACLHRALGELAERMPRYETRALTDHLRQGIAERR